MSQPLINADPQRPSADAPGFKAGKTAIHLRAPAKLNLSLVVRGPRQDGFHELHSVMATVDLCDDLRLAQGEGGIRLHCTGRPVPAGPENLVSQAAQLLARHTGIDPAVNIQLHKAIPAGGGLGGGSSDAAATLLGLNHLWGLALATEQLAQLAAQLGSDIPFFLYAPVAVCTGRGEHVQPIDQRCHRHVLLICPDVHVPTAEVYHAYRHDPALSSQLMDRVTKHLHDADLDALANERINMLRHTCLTLFPQLAALRNRIEQLGVGPLQLAGSGGVLFATSTDSDEIARWQRLLHDNHIRQVLPVQFCQNSQPVVEEHHADF